MKRTRVAGSLVLWAAVMACEPGARPPGPASTPQSTTVAVLGDRVVALDEDHGAVVFTDLEGGARESVPVGLRPAQLAVRRNMVAVTLKGERALVILDADTREQVLRLPVGVEPHGVAWVDDVRVVVALSGEDRVVVVHALEGRVEASHRTAAEGPFGVVVLPEGRVLVSHLLAGVLSELDLRTGGTLQAIPINLSAGGFNMNASLVASLTASPDGREVATGNVNLNNDNPDPTGAPPPSEENPGYLGGPTSLPAVNPTLTTVDTQTRIMTGTQPRDVPSPTEPFAGDCFDCGAPRSFLGPLPVALLNDVTGFQLNEPVAVGYLDGGRGMAVLARGSRNLFVFRRNADGTRGELLQVTPVGHGADGLAVSADGRKMVVHNAFDLALTVVDAPDLDARQAAPRGVTGPTRGTAQTTAMPMAQEKHGRTFAFAELTLDPRVAEGRRLFFDASKPGMTSGPGITCGTCHVQGRNDNRNWTFIDGPRNTPSLAGAAERRTGIASTTQPLHWRGELATHRDLQRTVTEFMGGHGLSDEELDAVGAFIDTIPSPDVLVPEDDASLVEIVRGEALFNDATVGCTTCHAGPHFTDNLNHDVGTAHGLPHGDFQTPVLHGLRTSAPYGHDGSYPTLEAMLDDLVRTNRMGRGDHLSDADLRALAAFLRTL